MKDLEKIKEFFSQPLPGQDTTDTISMDIPLFLRMLEYAKEDAQEDVDLHDVTQRAIELSKTKSFLSMEDYNEIVAAPQEIEEDAFEDTWALNRRKVQSFINQYKDNPFKETDIKYAQAYLNIDDLVDANKYWNNFNLKRITDSISSMESLKEIVRNTLTEKKKKRDRCLRIADRRYKKPSAYKSGAVVRCRDGEIWKGIKEGEEQLNIQDLAYQQTPEFLYHATYKPLLKKIKEKGLDTNDSKKAWEDSIPGYVYLALDPYVAESYAEESEMVPEGWLDNIIILKIDTNKLDKSKLFIDQNVQGNEGDTLEYRGVIPWEALSLYKSEQLTEKQKETLRTWFKRTGTPGKEGGWVDCNAPIRKDGKITGYKSCGRKKGEQRAKYPSCRPTAAKCKDSGKGTKWGKTK